MERGTRTPKLLPTFPYGPADVQYWLGCLRATTLIMVLPTFPYGPRDLLAVLSEAMPGTVLGLVLALGSASCCPVLRYRKRQS